MKFLKLASQSLYTLKLIWYNSDWILNSIKCQLCYLLCENLIPHAFLCCSKFKEKQRLYCKGCLDILSIYTHKYWEIGQLSDNQDKRQGAEWRTSLECVRKKGGRVENKLLSWQLPVEEKQEQERESHTFWVKVSHWPEICQIGEPWLADEIKERNEGQWMNWVKHEELLL